MKQGSRAAGALALHSLRTKSNKTRIETIYTIKLNITKPSLRTKSNKTRIETKRLFECIDEISPLRTKSNKTRIETIIIREI